MPTPTPTRRSLDRRIYWIGVAAWAVASWLIGDAAAQHMKWRINDLAAIPGAGMVVRNPDGVFYHIASDDKATAVFRPSGDAQAATDSDSVTSLASCGECTLLSGDQLAQINNFCAAGVTTELPKIVFEVPCKSWAPINEGPKVMATVIFLVPVLMLPLLRMLLEAAGDRRRKATVRTA